MPDPGTYINVNGYRWQLVSERETWGGRVASLHQVEMAGGDPRRVFGPLDTTCSNTPTPGPHR